MEKQNLEQNQEQTVEQLLKKYITVPEIQREYVWGSDKKLLETFLDDIVNTVRDNKQTTYNIGFLYSYAHSTREEYLIDGQQRFTTLILLAIYLAKVEGSTPTLNSLLKVEEPQQAFTYRVRSSAATFLHSLCLKEFDVRSDVMIKEVITASTWYVSSVYENDTTVQNMLNTLQIIHQWFTKNGKGCLSLNDVLTKVMFWHFNTEQAGQGEELYISMNSRGCPLTEAEQIKPLLFKELNSDDSRWSYGKKWDEWENTFFKMAGKNRDISSIDKAMRMMIRTVIELEKTTQRDRLNPSEDAKLVKLATIESYMDVIESLSQDYKKEVERLFGDSNSDARLYVLKALIIEKKRGRNDARELQRIAKIVENGLRRGTMEHLPLLKFLKAYASDKVSTFYEFVLNNEVYHEKLFDKHEILKISMYYNYDKNQRQDLENTCWQAESHVLWGGDISILLEWSKDENRHYNIHTLKQYQKTIELLFKNGKSNPEVSDETRQAIISRKLDHYPLRSNWTYAKFGYRSDEWRDIFRMNSQGIKAFLDEPKTRAGKPEIKTWKDDYDYKEVADNDYLLKYCNYKHFYWNDDHGWLLVKNQWAQPIAVFNMHMYENHKEEPLFINNGWEIRIWVNWDGCVVIENRKEDIAFDLWKVRTNKTELVDGEEVSKKVVICKVRVFRRNHENDLKHPNGWTEEVDDDTQKVKCYQYESVDEQEVIDRIIELIKGYNKQANN